MAKRDIVVIGASAGGISALMMLAHALSGYRGSLLAVVHTSTDSPRVLPSMLSRQKGLAASYAKDGEKFKAGHIHIAPPDFHLLVKDGRMHLSRGPRENRLRPAVDPLFRTAARALGPRVVGIVLSGGLDDGTDGLRIIKHHGGVAIAQDPAEAIFPSTPDSAIRNGNVDHVAPLKNIVRLIRHYARQNVPEERAMGAKINKQPDVAEAGDTALREGSLGPPSALTCPDCGGALWEIESGNHLRYHCHVGHSYTADGLKTQIDANLEEALWSAVRILEEASALRLRMAQRAHTSGWSHVMPPYAEQAQQLRERADLIRALLTSTFGNGQEKTEPHTNGTPRRKNKSPKQGAARRKAKPL